MKAPAVSDLTQFDRTIEILEAILRHRRARPTVKSEEVYFELMIEYYRRIRDAKANGKLIAAHTVMFPTEIIYAMDMVPMQLEFAAGTMARLLDGFEDCFDVAREFGLTVETCSPYRALVGAIIKGWLPRPDVVLWSHQVCDNTSKIGIPLLELLDCPGFYLDQPYRNTSAEFDYYLHEMGELVAFLEERVGRPMDQDRLRDAAHQSQKMIDLHREIRELRKAPPGAMLNRQGFQLFLIHWFFRGSPDAVAFCEVLRDDIRDRAAEKAGLIPEEKLRLLSLFIPSVNKLNIWDWMQTEHGANIVMETWLLNWGEGDVDLERPLESISRLSHTAAICRQMHGPVEEGYIPDSVRDAREFQADGGIYVAHLGCRQGCAAIRPVRDALMEQASIPTITLAGDMVDPNFCSDEELMDALEGFFETLHDRK
ncbi:MAG: 2-hydroxyacyl-CoA dehydratase family protein [Dehalococcoidia bacterium]